MSLVKPVQRALTEAFATATADALVIVTKWDAFRALDFDPLAVAMRTRTLVDFRNVYRPEDVTSQGFAYFCIGRPAASENPKQAAR